MVVKVIDPKVVGGDHEEKQQAAVTAKIDYEVTPQGIQNIKLGGFVESLKPYPPQEDKLHPYEKMAVDFVPKVVGEKGSEFVIPKGALTKKKLDDIMAGGATYQDMIAVKPDLGGHQITAEVEYALDKQAYHCIFTLPFSTQHFEIHKHKLEDLHFSDKPAEAFKTYIEDHVAAALHSMQKEIVAKLVMAMLPKLK